MTLPRLYGMNRYWRKFPPAHICLKAGFGIKEAPEEKARTFEDFMQDFAAQGGRIDGVR